jgi:hypothetical protein
MAEWSWRDGTDNRQAWVNPAIVEVSPSRKCHEKIGLHHNRRKYHDEGKANAIILPIGTEKLHVSIITFCDGRDVDTRQIHNGRKQIESRHDHERAEA